MSAAHTAKMLWWRDESTIELLKKSLIADHVSLTSTDTILGFLAHLSEKGHSQLDAIKQSKPDKPYLVLIGSPCKVASFVDMHALDQRAQCVIKKCWPGPLTIIFKAKAGVPQYLQSKDGTIALRCPRHQGLLHILEHFDGLFSTSANKSGQNPATIINEVPTDMLTKVEYVILDHKEAQAHVPSTVIDMTTGTVKLVRSGAYPLEKLEQLCGVLRV
jgi:L-threonylcarbamoyladenylate synthase